MNDEFGEFSERLSKSKSKKKKGMTLEKTVEMGEYNPQYLSTFPERITYSKIIRWQYIRRALKNRRQFLLLNWAETNNVLDFRLKPDMKLVLDNINKQIEFINKEEKRFRLEYLT